MVTECIVQVPPVVLPLWRPRFTAETDYFRRAGDRAFYQRTDRYAGATVKPVFLCSDAHNTEQIGGWYTWVKALPTFEGLRQALLEPESLR